jgi:hypothetical protein
MVTAHPGSGAPTTPPAGLLRQQKRLAVVR